MATKTKPRRNRQVADSYLNRIVAFPLTSIKSQDQLEAAQAMIDLLVMNGTLDEGDELYLDALSDLVAAYEDVHFPIAPAGDADMLRHLMDAKGVTQAALHRQTGIPKSTISEVLAGKKSFSRGMIRTLADFFKVDISVLASNL
jgi:HTH-type transcriptional regulator / antitoxin HigA